MESMISNSLGTAFPNAEIWIEQIDAGFMRPAFFVQRITGVFKQIIGNRYTEENSYMIAYFSDKPNQDINTDIMAVANTMCSVLKTISYGGEMLHGKDINYRTEDGVLQFFVSYKRNLAEPKNKEILMNKVKIETE
ncbi:MAG: hypothetical protein RR385_09390 [Clostridiales bacterium]